MDNNLTKGTPWAIVPGHYEVLADNYRAIQASAELMKEAAKFNPKTGKIELNIIDGVAVIGIRGAITNRISFFSWLYGGAAIPDIRRELEAAAQSHAVKAILMDFDSPGGTVPGVDDLAGQIRAMGKPVIAYTGGLMCSAAIWLGSAADKIIAGKTAELGSIGVLMVHTDYSEMHKQDGIKKTVLTAGKYKAVGTPHSPLTQEGRDTIQAELDYLYSIFVDAVAANRGVSVEKALEMADGKTFIGQQAVDVGLADAVGTFDQALEMARDMGTPGTTYHLKTGEKPTKEGKKTMAKEEIGTVEDLKAAFPELAAQLVQEGTDGVDIKTKTKEAVAAETERIMGLASIQFKDDEGKFKTLVESGISVDQFKAIKGLEPEAPAGGQDSKAGEMLDEIKKANAQDPGQGGSDGDAPKTFMVAWQAIKKAEDCDTRTAMSKAAREYPKLYDAHAKGGK